MIFLGTKQIEKPGTDSDGKVTQVTKCPKKSKKSSSEKAKNADTKKRNSTKKATTAGQGKD